MNPRKQNPDGTYDRLRQLCVSMDEDMLLVIDRAARDAGMSRSEWVRDQLTTDLLDLGYDP